ncbi:MAG: dTDP-4-dehydrorhamnose 3,5-epimerase [bacterium]
MDIKKTKLKGVFILKNQVFQDERGLFCKTYHYEFFKNNNICNNFKESYYSVSKKNVIRGMHFQLPPFDHDKLVYVPRGEVLDVILDLRKDSDTYGEYIEVNLSGENRLSVYIPKGLAHGFKSLKDNTITIYNVSTVYKQESDSGVRWDSFGMNWNIKNPIVSSKDKGLVEFNNFDSPFYIWR